LVPFGPHPFFAPFPPGWGGWTDFVRDFVGFGDILISFRGGRKGEEEEEEQPRGQALNSVGCLLACCWFLGSLILWFVRCS